MSRRQTKMKKADIIAENERLLKMVEASRQLYERTIKELERKILHFKDDVIYGANFVKEIKKLIGEYEPWYDKIIKKYVDEENDNGNSSDNKTN